MARRTNTRVTALLFLAVAMMAALIVGLFLYQTFRNYEAELATAEQVEEMQTIVVAARELTQGLTLSEDDIMVREIPVAFVPEGTFETLDLVIDRVPKERILPGEYIRDDRLASSEAGVGLNAIIPQGQRAVSINVTDGSAVSGFLNPGNYVDVLVTIRGDDRKEQTVTLLQAVRVLAVDSRLGGRSDNPEVRGRYKPSVTLAVTPEQALKLAYSNIEGDVVLTLRNDIDVTGQETHTTTSSTLLESARVPLSAIEPTPAPRSRPRVEEPDSPRELLIIRGSESERRDPTPGRPRRR